MAWLLIKQVELLLGCYWLCMIRICTSSSLHSGILTVFWLQTYVMLGVLFGGYACLFSNPERVSFAYLNSYYTIDVLHSIVFPKTLLARSVRHVLAKCGTASHV